MNIVDLLPGDFITTVHHSVVDALILSIEDSEHYMITWISFPLVIVHNRLNSLNIDDIVIRDGKVINE